MTEQQTWLIIVLSTCDWLRLTWLWAGRMRLVTLQSTVTTVLLISSVTSQLTTLSSCTQIRATTLLQKRKSGWHVEIQSHLIMSEILRTVLFNSHSAGLWCSGCCLGTAASGAARRRHLQSSAVTFSMWLSVLSREQSTPAAWGEETTSALIKI